MTIQSKMEFQDITKIRRRAETKPRSDADETLFELLGKNVTNASAYTKSENSKAAETNVYRAYTVGNFKTPATTPAPKLKNGEHDVTTLDQWIEITVRDGRTITKYFPTNEKLLQKLAAADPPPDLIYRRFHFRHGVPPEYDWMRPNANQRANGGICMQRLLPDDFRTTVPKEVNGHALSGSDPRPRPQARGGCTCSACTAQTKRLEASGTPYL